MWIGGGGRGGTHLDNFCCIPLEGASGGLIIGWRSSSFERKLIHLGKYCSIVEFTNQPDQFSWLCTIVYGPNKRHLKPDSWNEIRISNDARQLPWIICGDFNVIFSLNDKSLDNPNLEDISNAQKLIRDLNLIEPPLRGRKFTWTNG